MSGVSGRCPGCGASVTTSDTVSAPGGAAARECSDAFDRALAASYESPVRRAVHQLVVDAYIAQHGGGTAPKEVQSVAVCLMTLKLFVDDGVDPRRGPVLHRRMTDGPVEFLRLEPPAFTDGGPTVWSLPSAGEGDDR